MNKKLNLKWVADTIGNDYKKWKRGDIILIQAQTGTGKTFFVKNTLIPHLDYDEKMLIVCNRRYLKMQIKIDLLKRIDPEGYIQILKNHGIESCNISDLRLDDLEKITQIDNVTIVSYHKIQYLLIDEQYLGKEFSLDEYDYIVCDEAHYITHDASFNNKTRFAFQKLTQEHMPSSKLIFISATLDDIQRVISNRYNNRDKDTEDYSLHIYSTGIDYSYLDIKYLKRDNVQNIVNLIRNDTTDEKWLIFVSSHKTADKIKEALGDISEIVRSGSNNEEIKSIIATSKFNCKVLIATKVLDNGVNFNDDKLTNIIIQAWDEITFIQELGRKRINIEDAQKVNLYIPRKSKMSFSTLRTNSYNKIEKAIKLYETDIVNFNKKYDLDANKIPATIFYKDKESWEINAIGYYNFTQTLNFIDDMMDKLSRSKYAYILEQLSWLELEHTFNSDSLLGEIVNLADKEKEDFELKEYLSSIVDTEFLTVNDRTKLIEHIGAVDKNHSNLKENKLVYFKSLEAQNSVLREKELPFEIIQLPPTSRKINGKKKNYNAIWKLIKSSEI
jgi:superfamily II DNA or RNA helicase